MLETNIDKDKDKSSWPTLAIINGGFIRGDRVYKNGSIFLVREILMLPTSICAYGSVVEEMMMFTCSILIITLDESSTTC